MSSTGDHRPTVVLMLGEPGSGKTRLGTELARFLRVPFLARDDVRGGLYLSRGGWGEEPVPGPPGGEAVEAFLSLVEAMADRGVSCVAEYVFRSARPQELQRITDVARCVGIVARCDDPAGRRIARDLADPLLRRPAVLEAAGVRSVDELVQRSETRIQQLAGEMLQVLPIPLLIVETNSAWSPPLGRIAEFVVASTTPSA
jgi:predicted kinase